MEALISRRGKPAARLVAPAAGKVASRSRASLREEVPAMRESAGATVRSLRDDERY